MDITLSASRYGYNPGCLHVDPEKGRAAYHDAVWYSLPGRCPSRDLYSSLVCLLAYPCTAVYGLNRYMYSSLV